MRRDTFRQALSRAKAAAVSQGTTIECSGVGYRIIGDLGCTGETSLYLACSTGAHPYLATVCLSSDPGAASRFTREAEVLRQLAAGVVSGLALRLLPDVVAHGPVVDGDGRFALVLRHPAGFWGNLAALNQRFPNGIDPRHAVWIWRRMLEVLHLVHGMGWAHGDIRPEHGLVHPADHGVLLIGWGSAVKGEGAKACAEDLSRSARVVMMLLGGAGPAMPAAVPEPLSRLVSNAGHDVSFCESHGASGLDALLRDAAREAFGPPAFVPLVI
ncbi:MAG: protein kinase family protein [Verrucomicrobia bacterium]|nr:protein kinase family protein [Verrucomicrobiota bacterium]